MPVFSYKASDAAGRIVSDTIEAADEKSVAAELHDMGYIPIRISGAGKKDSAGLSSFFSADFAFFRNRISSKDVMFFTQDLTALLESGLPVDRSLKILVAASENERLSRIIQEILKAIEGGKDLSDAMADHPKVFTDFYINMVRAGESGGVLVAVLKRVAGFLETSNELKDYIKSALVYPVFLIFVGIVSIIILFTFVIPKFSVVFEDMGESIPASARIMLTASDLVVNFWWAGAGIIAAAALIVYRFSRTETGRKHIDRIKLKTPLIGDLVLKVEIGRITRTLGTLINSGVPILESLNLSKNIVSNSVVSRSMVQVHESVKEGEELSDPLEKAKIFPPLSIHMIKVGEETGRMAEMLLRVADNYEKVVKNSVKRLISLLEPALILIMGVIVGSIVVSMLMAVFSMNDLPF